MDNKKAEDETRIGFTITLDNGRRIESLGPFADAEFARLIRIVENA